MSELEREDLKFHNVIHSFSKPPFHPVRHMKQTNAVSQPHLTDHCLSSLLSTLTCHPDISLITMRWGHTQPIPLGNFSAAHECANWDALDGWSAGRRVDVLRPGWLRHPVLGASFPEGKGVRTGVGHDG
ncbi:MAG: hypothetical protein LQ349_004155 [Xanthoria aureola]|nr:MAG: hypothetical protein LQ349_004155 [Xanthoria aureola]